MNFKVIFSMVFLSGTVSAKSLTCDLINDSNPPSWPKDQISALYNEEGIETVDYLSKIPNDDGSFKDKAERIYSRTYSDNSNRGGYKVSYCNPDENEISEVAGRLFINAQCVLKGSSDQVVFKFNYFPKKLEGNFSMTLMLSDDVIERSGNFVNCR